ncbi:MAG: hypothetical protein Q4Q07_07355 [Tissierellia bacterium]|nr:hypothetical protein [Tissierellia bacterium]
MWLVFGILAIVFAWFNLYKYLEGKDSRIFMFLSLAFTALVLCELYRWDAKMIAHEDWTALMDVTPTMVKASYVLTLLSILVNSVPILKKQKS